MCVEAKPRWGAWFAHRGAEWGHNMDLTALNVWLDEIFFWVWMAAIAFVVFHYSLSLFKLPVGSEKSRFRKSVIEHHWPEHDHRPPATPKWIHGIHMFSIVLLAITGMYIRFPQLMGARDFMRNFHYFLGFVATFTFVWRVWYAFFSKHKDYKEFAIRKVDLQSLLGVLAYYGYFSNNKPHVAKYNCAQKASYLLFVFMMIAQIFTGFALIRYNWLFGTSFSAIVTSPLSPFLGGQAATMWYMRMIHYVLNWAFIIMMTIHFYLAASVDIPCTLDFFGLTTMKTTGGHGHGDEHGAEAPAPAAPAAGASPAANLGAAISASDADPLPQIQG